MLKHIELTKTLPDNVILKIGKYLIAEKLGTYSKHIYARITDRDNGYYIVCGMYKEDYIKEKEKIDSLKDIYFKIDCDSDRYPERYLVIIEAGDYPKFKRRIICGRDFLTFEQNYNIIKILEPYIIKTKYD